MSTSVEVPTAGLAQAESDDRQPRRREAAPYVRRRSSLRRLWPYIRPHRLPLFAGLASSLISSSTAIVIPVVTARIIDGPIAHRHFGAIVLPTLLVLLLGVIDALGAWGRRMLVSHPSSQVEITLRAKIFRKLQALSVGVHDSWESGQLLSRAVDDLSTLRRFVAFSGIFLVINLTVLPIGLVVLFTLDWRLGLAQTIISIPLSYLCVRFERQYSMASRTSQDQVGDLATIAEESAQGIRVLKAFGRGPFLGARFTAQSQLLRSTELRKVRLDAILWSALNGLPRLVIAFAIGYGGYAVTTGQMTVGTLVAGISLATFLQWPIAWTGFLLADLNDARTAADRYWEIIDTPIDIVDPPHPVSLPPHIKGELRLDHVRFRFANDGGDGAVRVGPVPDDVLVDVGLLVRPGETVALVGATGSGKTALLGLIPRLYDTTSGAVRIDGIDVAELRVADLRSIVTVAFEEPVLFSASVRENVALGSPQATDTDVRRALDVACATEFVDELPWGLDTRIGEQGLSLSGGQRQRLALARAVLSARRGAGVVVLDDPLSALDVETEERVHTRLRSELAGSTTLLVAHRPSTAALADRVALLAGGRIVAEGTHEHLLETSSRYRELMGGAA